VCRLHSMCGSERQIDCDQQPDFGWRPLFENAKAALSRIKPFRDGKPPYLAFNDLRSHSGLHFLRRGFRKKCAAKITDSMIFSSCFLVGGVLISPS
jgi:hypothetical protein